MIHAINLRNLRNAEYLQFLKDTLSLTLANDPVALNIKPQYDALTVQVNDLETLFKIKQANDLSDELLQLDERRDLAISGIRQVVAGYRNHFTPSIAGAASVIYENIMLYGENIERQNYMAQTATLNGIVSDWENKPELTAALTLLGLQSWKAEMKASNSLFNEKYLLRTQQYGLVTDETLSSEKAQTNELYYTLRENITARATIDSTQAYLKIINEVNALVDQYNVLLRNREPKKENENPPL